MLSVLLASAALQQPNLAVTPERVLLTLTDNPDRQTVVSWRSKSENLAGQGQIVKGSPDPRSVANPKSVDATGTTVKVGTDTYTYYTVKFTDLEPGTEYAYRVGSPTAPDKKQAWSEWIHFKTAKSEVAPFSFIYFGDAQNDLKSLWSRTIRRACRDMPYADFMMHAGDLVNVGDRDSEWGEWFYAGGWVHGSIPCLATPGNHEYARDPQDSTKRALTYLWKPQFNYPANGVPGLESTNYVIDYQGARIISLNSNEKIKEQTAWLDKTLSQNPKKWTFVTFHHPVYSTAAGRDNKTVRDEWQPILQKHKVAIVLQGHDHTYGRRNVPTGVTGTDPKSGTVYVVSVSGPKMYRLGAEVEKDMPRVAEYTQLYQLIRVMPDKVRFEAYTITGDLYDAFELTKNRDGSNHFKDLAPKTPNRKEAAAAAKQSGGN